MHLLFRCFRLLFLFAAASIPSACSHPQPCREPCVVLIGDSIISRWPALQQPGQISGLQIINRGVSGDTTAHMLARFDHDVIQIRPRVVVVLGGINDIARTPVPVIESHLEKMAQAAHQHQIRVVLVAIPPTGMAPSAEPTPAGESAQNQIRSLNESLQSLAAQHHYAFLDLHTPLADEHGYYIPSLTSDGVHPTAGAYQRLDAPLREAIAAAMRDAAHPAL